MRADGGGDRDLRETRFYIYRRRGAYAYAYYAFKRHDNTHGYAVNCIYESKLREETKSNEVKELTAFHIAQWVWDFVPWYYCLVLWD